MAPDYDTPRMWPEAEPEDAVRTAMREALTRQGEGGAADDEVGLSGQAFRVAAGGRRGVHVVPAASWWPTSQRGALGRGRVCG